MLAEWKTLHIQNNLSVDLLEEELGNHQTHRQIQLRQKQVIYLPHVMQKQWYIMRPDFTNVIADSMHFTLIPVY